MAASQAKKLVVCGGSGFLGSQICQKAIHRGWAVTSLTRKGTPPEDQKNSKWVDQVHWARADLLDPSTYASEHLSDAAAVVHSIGILLETDYKGLVQGRAGSPFELLASLAKAVTPAKPGPGAGSPSGPSYEQVNTQSAIQLAGAVAEATKSHRPVPFVYVSAAGPAPLLPAGYINSKRETERQLSLPEWATKLHPLFIRPGFLYPSWSSSGTTAVPSLRQLMSIPMVVGGHIASAVEDALGQNRLSRVLGEGTTTKPLSTDEVGSAVVELLDQLADTDTLGSSRWPPASVISARELERLATASWRKDLA